MCRPTRPRLSNGFRGIIRSRRILGLMLLAAGIVGGIHEADGDPGLPESQERTRQSKGNKKNPGVTSGQAGDGTMYIRTGHATQVGGCPQAITEEEAVKRIADKSLPGNIMHLVGYPHSGGRTGNHYMMLSRFFSLAYCCKSKLLILPETSKRFPTQDGEIFETTRRWFDFSNSVMPLPDFEGFANNSKICKPRARFQEESAFYLEGIKRDLYPCMNRVLLRGCEAEYLGDLVRTSEYCPRKGGDSATGVGNSLGHVEADVTYGKADATRVNGSESISTLTEQDPDGPSLVIHVRSGDIFRVRNRVSVKYGQPPLQYYLAAIGHQAWSKVSIITATTSEKLANPVFTVLESMVRLGALGSHVKAFKNRDLLTDMKALMCADALAISVSTLHFLTLSHSKATKFFMPGECKVNREIEMKRPSIVTLRDMASRIVAERPDAEVYGTVWDGEIASYGAFKRWDGSLDQKMEMVAADKFLGFQRCRETF